MLTAVLLFCVGLLCLVKGGDWFVDGAVGIARRFHLPDLLIGATVVSVGTTLPEVMISASSAMGGHGEIAYGNAIGSIICNAALVAAITIAVRPGKADAAALRLPVSFFLSRRSFTRRWPTPPALSAGGWASSCWPSLRPIWRRR